jgi:hypothetical protein
LLALRLTNSYRILDLHVFVAVLLNESKPVLYFPCVKVWSTGSELMGALGDTYVVYNPFPGT